MSRDRILLIACLLFVALFALQGCGGSSSSDDVCFLCDTGPATPTPTPAPEDDDDDDELVEQEPSEPVSSTVVSRFVWKPISERDENLAVLVDPSNVRVEVTGSISETLTNTGASNGYGTTARGSFPGCSYGDNVVVEFFDSQNRRIKVYDGANSVSVPVGCTRYEFG